MVKEPVVRRLSRRSRTAKVLDCPLSMVKKLEAAGLLTKIRLGGRDVFHRVEEVEAVANGSAVIRKVKKPVTRRRSITAG